MSEHLQANGECLSESNRSLNNSEKIAIKINMCMST